MDRREYSFTVDSGALGDYGRIQFVLNRADGEPGKTLAFPEGTIRSWTPTTLEFFADGMAAIRAHRTPILLGVLVPQLSEQVSTASYPNAVLQIGRTTELLDQRVPVPFGMWKPFERGGVQLDTWQSGIARIGIDRAALLICYEQLLAWPVILSTISAPTITVGLANDAWVMNSQYQLVKALICARGLGCGAHPSYPTAGRKLGLAQKRLAVVSETATLRGLVFSRIRSHRASVYKRWRTLCPPA